MIILSRRGESKLGSSTEKTIVIESSLYNFAVHGNPDAALLDEGFSWAKVCS